MKKFICILLIAIIACEVVEDDLLLKESAVSLEELIKKIKNSGLVQKFKGLLKSGGKPAAAAACCVAFPALCGLCGTAVTML